MKRLILSVLFVIIGVFAFAQDKSEPMKFMGISMDLPVNKFVAELKKKGLKKISGGKLTLLKGEFITFSNCMIGVIRNDKDKKKIDVATVMMPGTTSWESLSSIYYSLKTLLTEKYGNPIYSIEEFESEPFTNSEYMHELRMNKCKYESRYKLNSGDINLKIIEDHNSNGSVLITYFPRKNVDNDINKILNDL